MILVWIDVWYDYGFVEVIDWVVKFKEFGVDIFFVEVLKMIEEMSEICWELFGFKMVNIVEGGEMLELSYKEF